MTNLLLWILQSTALIAVAAVAAWCMRSARPSARLALWQLTLFTTLVLPVLRPWQREVVAVTPLIHNAGAAAAAKPSTGAPGPTLPGPGQALEYLIAAGIALKFAHLALGIIRLRQYRRESQPFAKHPEAEILISESVPSPVTFGFVDPVVLLPGHFASLDPALQETILYHEILHVRRRDWLFAVSEEIIRSVLWFHPAIWWTVREIHLAREEAVDREVVETLNAREAYVDALLAIAGTPLGRQWAAASFFVRRKQLKQRVISIFREVNMSKTRSVSALLAGCCALALTCWFITGALPLQAQPQTVQDGPGVSVDTNGARLIHRPAVEFPFKTTIGGTVVAQVKTDANGNVVDATITSGPDELRKPVLQSLLDWHFTHDSANSTRQITVTFTPPPAPPERTLGLPANRVGANQPPMTLSDIVILGLPDADRDQLLAQLPVHIGDSYTPELRAQVLQVAKSFDEHMMVGLTIRSQSETGSKVVLRLALPGAPLMPAPASRPTADAVAPAPPSTLKPVRIGGAVMTANLINQVKPTYPALAKAAGVQGTVEFEATIGTDGTMQQLHLLSGPPLLVQAAMQAVQQWVYKPTLLNGQPVEVITTVSVNFELPSSN